MSVEDKPLNLSMTASIARNCPVCGSDDAQPHLQKGDLRLVRCSHCAMIYANPVPAEYASGEYYDHAGAEYYLSPAARRKKNEAIN